MSAAQNPRWWMWIASTWLAVACAAPALPSPGQKGASASIHQGLWAGRDPKVAFRNGQYYYIEHSVGGHVLIFRSSTPFDRGEPRILPPGFPLVVLSFVEELGGQRHDKWFAFGPDTWRLDGQDPYDDADRWTKIGSFGFSDFALDFHAFQPESGPHAGEWFLTWAGSNNNKPGEWWFESIFLSRMKSPTELEQSDCGQAAEIVSFYARSVWNAASNAWDWIPGHPVRPMTYPVPGEHKGGWKDVIVEAPNVVQKDGTISLIYSGDGAHTIHYGMGIAFCKDGDVDNKASWIDYNQQIKADPAFQWDVEKGVFGPGVASVVPSPDGQERWMYYHAKTFHTWNDRDPANEEGQSGRECWNRFINLQRIGWQTIQHEGRAHTLPALGSPLAPGAALPALSADPGLPAPKTRKIEAEFMIPFGNGMGDINQTPGLNATSDKASLNAYLHNLDALAQGAPGNQSGLIYRNCPAANQLVLSAASTADCPLLHLYVNDQKVRDLPLQKTAAADAFIENTFEVSIPEGAELRLVHEIGKTTAANLDYIKLETQNDPEPVPPNPDPPSPDPLPPQPDTSNLTPPQNEPALPQVIGNGCATATPTGLSPLLLLALALRKRYRKPGHP